MVPPTRGVIAAGHDKTAEAGLEMFRLGGNAFDAAVAAVLAACVAEPTLTSLAGGGFLLAHTHTNDNILFDFFAHTPLHKDDRRPIDFYPVDVNFGSVTQEFHIGLGSMAVPGTIGGLLHVHQRLGRLPQAVVFEPAIQFARAGVEVSAFQAYCIHILSPILLRSPQGRRLFARQGQPLRQGDQLHLPELADTLAHLAQSDRREFYCGEIGQRLVQDCQSQGGYLTQADLDSYQVVERSPLKTTYRDTTFLTNPPPSSGGLLIAFALQLLAHVDVGSIAFGSPEHIHLMATVMRLTNRVRQEEDEAFLHQADAVSQFLAPDRLAHWSQALKQAIANEPLPPSGVNKWGSTTHISTIDAEGNAASVTTSNGEGSSYVIPGTGIMVNNMLGEADLHPTGFHQWQPGVRISSMMAPTLILDAQQRPELALGSGGSNRIRTAILQVISNLVDFQMPVEQAVSSPRLHWEDGVLNLEPGFDLSSFDRQQFPFTEQVEQWQTQNMFFGGVHAVSRHGEQGLAGAGDRRRSGVVRVL